MEAKPKTQPKKKWAWNPNRKRWVENGAPVTLNDQGMRICNLKGCEAKHKGNGFCHTHNSQMNKGIEPYLIIKNPLCSFKDCNDPAVAKGLCSGHYQQRRAGKPLKPKKQKQTTVCQGPECDRKEGLSDGLCGGHQAQKRRGKPLTPLRKPQAAICSFSGCDNPTVAKGLCSGHYQQFKAGRPLTPLQRKYPPICMVDGCERPHEGHGYCSKHRQQKNPPLRIDATTPEGTCLVLDCTNTAIEDGICDQHPNRDRRDTPKHHVGCKVEGCLKPHKGDGFCRQHLREERRKQKAKRQQQEKEEERKRIPPTPLY